MSGASGSATPVNLDRVSQRHLIAGFAVGVFASAMGGLYTVYARYGLANGLHASDIVFLRFAVAGVLMLPLLFARLRTDGRAVLARWKVWLAVMLLSGPLFGLMMFGAFEFAPASHAAVFPFSTMSVMGTLFAAWFLGDPLTPRKVIGIVVVVVGLVLLSGFDPASLTPRALIGDALFIAAGTMWAGFGILLRKHRLDAWQTTALVSAFALVTYVPAFLVFDDTSRLAQATPWLLAVEVVVQGVVAGVGTLYFYNKIVTMLGAARAAIFPALAPGLTVLIGWPVLGHVPDGFETAGLCIAVAGLLITVTKR